MFKNKCSKITTIKDISQKDIIEIRRKNRKIMLDRLNQQLLIAKKAINELEQLLS